MRASITSLLLLGVLAAARPAHAEPAPARAPAKTAKADVSAAIAKLKSGKGDQIRAGLDEIRIAATGASAAAPAVVELLGKGLDATLTQQAIDTLGDIESPEGSAVLAQYAQHRTVAIRRAAIRALTRTKGAPAAPALRRALGDQDAQVRGTASAGLGSLKAKDAVPDLFVALDHKVTEAAAAIGQLCTGDACEKLADKLGKLPFDVVTSGLEQVLGRPANDVSDDAKIKIIGKIRELGTAEGNRFLKEVEKRLPKEASPRLRQAVDQAIKATNGATT